MRFPLAVNVMTGGHCPRKLIDLDPRHCAICKFSEVDSRGMRICKNKKSVQLGLFDGEDVQLPLKPILRLDLEKIEEVKRKPRKGI